ncbi:MAG: tetraacyldisaccharide 4'-kinase [Oxalobacteraceae bacterium]
MSLRTFFETLFSREWQRRGWLAWSLLPLSWLFGGVTFCRRWLYDAGLFRSHAIAVPVIVVGNVYVGGTGKTPLVIWLVQQLREHGFVPGVISRGHGRDAEQVQQVREDTPVSIAGDEPWLIRQRSGAPVFVGRRRAAAADALLAAYPNVTVLIADDGLQHYALQRDIEILLSDERGVGNGWLLPAGPLRESASRRFDFRVVNGGVEGAAAAEQHTFSMRLQATHAWQLSDHQQRLSWSEFSANSRVAAAAGMGHPERFFLMLRKLGLNLSQTLPLPDHFDFSTNPLADLDAHIILITEKDAVKCAHIEAIASDSRVWVVPVQAAIDGPLSTHLVEKLRGYPTA